jgi:hypothetical protein
VKIALAVLIILLVSSAPAPATSLAPHLECTGIPFPPGPDWMVSRTRAATTFAALLENARKPCDLIVMVWSSAEIPGRVSLNRVSCLIPSDDPGPYRTGPSYAIDSQGNIVSILSEDHWTQVRRSLLGF